jgi:hypothetical protein
MDRWISHGPPTRTCWPGRRTSRRRSGTDDDAPADALAALAADGVDELVVRFRDGSRVRRAFAGNAVYVPLDRWPTGGSDPGGGRQSVAISGDERPFTRALPNWP